MHFTYRQMFLSLLIIILFVGPVFGWSAQHTFLGLRSQQEIIKMNAENTTGIIFNEFGANIFHLQTPTNTEAQRNSLWRGREEEVQISTGLVGENNSLAPSRCYEALKKKVKMETQECVQARCALYTSSRTRGTVGEWQGSRQINESMPLIILSPYCIDQSHRPAWNINHIIYSSHVWTDPLCVCKCVSVFVWGCESTIITSKQMLLL